MLYSVLLFHTRIIKQKEEWHNFFITCLCSDRSERNGKTMILISKFNKILRPDPKTNEREFFSSNSIFHNYRYFKVHKELDFNHARKKWLGQFSSQAEQDEMINMVLNNLLYIPAAFCEETISEVWKYHTSIKTNKKNEAVFLVGLSDGARLDLVRSYNEQIFTFQFSLEFEINESKCNTFMKKMKQSIGTSEIEALNIVLIDEFLASGISFIRYEAGTWKGKLIKVFNQLIPIFEKYTNNISISILTYYATEKGEQYLEKSLNSYLAEDSCTPISIESVNRVPKAELNIQQIKIIEKIFNQHPILDRHYQKGAVNRPYLGFDESQLMIVFEHNTPNNSLPIIWHKNGIFPRQNRHVI